MRKRLILIGAITIVCSSFATSQAPLISWPLYVTDGSKIDTIYFGIDPLATNGIDAAFGEASLPPAPPGFEARFVGTNIGVPELDLGSYVDIRPSSALPTQRVHQVKYVTDSSKVTISWSFPSWLTGRLTDLFGGFFYNDSMFGAGSRLIGPPGQPPSLVSSMQMTIYYSPDTPLPVQLASFTAQTTGLSTVLLEWSTVSEVNNFGFEVQRKGSSDPSFASLPGVFIPGHGTTIEPHYYSHTDETASAGQWSYRLKQIDYDGTTSFSPVVVVDILTGVGAQEIPTEYYLDQNYPNPFNPSTVIEYGLPERANVSLTVYNSLGQVVATLVQGEQEKGVHTVRLNAANLSSGVYMYTLQAGNFVSTKKLMLVR